MIGLGPDGRCGQPCVRVRRRRPGETYPDRLRPGAVREPTDSAVALGCLIAVSFPSRLAPGRDRPCQGVPPLPGAKARRPAPCLSRTLTGHNEGVAPCLTRFA